MSTATYSNVIKVATASTAAVAAVAAYYYYESSMKYDLINLPFVNDKTTHTNSNFALQNTKTLHIIYIYI